MSDVEGRTLRIYDEEGDFLITIPENAKVTFGYFNPGIGDGNAFNDGYGGRGRGGGDARKTALRIYTTGSGDRQNQLAVFLGVKGFRDESIVLTRLREEIILTQDLHDDGDGNSVALTTRNKQVIARREPTLYN